MFFQAYPHAILQYPLYFPPDEHHHGQSYSRHPVPCYRGLPKFHGIKPPSLDGPEPKWKM